MYKNNSISKEEKESLFSFFFVYAIVTVLVYFLPYTKYTVPYAIAGSLMLASLLLVIMKPSFRRFAAVLMVTSLLTSLALILGSSLVEGINEFIRNVRFYIPVIWGCYVLGWCSKRSRNTFLLVFAVLISVLLINTLAALAEDPWIARILAQDKSSSDAEVNAYRLQNIGGFEFSYAMGILTVSFLWMFLKIKKVFPKISCILAAVISYYYIIQTMYATLLILTTLGILLLLFLNVKNLYARILLAVMGLGLIFFMAPLFRVLATLFPDDSLLTVKFESIYKSMLVGDSSILGSRPEKMLDGIKIWLQYPIFGSGGLDVSSHSTIVSSLSNTGIVGFIGLAVMLFYSRKMIMKSIAENGGDSTLFTVSFVYVLLLAFFNPIGYVFEVSIIVFFIVPMICCLFKKDGDSIDKTSIADSESTV